MAARKALDALAAEAAPAPDVIKVPFMGNVLHVKPIAQWSVTALRAIRENNYDLWAEKVLVGNDYRVVWQRLDPMLSDLEEFFEHWNEITGVDKGK